MAILYELEGRSAEECGTVWALTLPYRLLNRGEIVTSALLERNFDSISRRKTVWISVMRDRLLMVSRCKCISGGPN